MKYKLLLSLLFFSYVSCFSQIDSVFLYMQDSTKQYWFYQQDVFAFHLINDESFIANDTIIDNVEYYLQDKINVVKFKNTSTISQRNLFKQNISNQINFDYECFTVSTSKDNINDYTKNQFNVTYPFLIVRFYEDLVDSLIIDTFAIRNDLTLVDGPSSSMPNQYTWSFFFLMDSVQSDTNFIKCQRIFENEEIVKFIEPNMSLFFAPPELPDEFDFTTDIGNINIDEVFVYPNPTKGDFTIVNNSLENTHFSIINTSGQTVYQSKLFTKETKLNFNDLSIPNGIYIINIEGKSPLCKKVIFY